MSNGTAKATGDAGERAFARLARKLGLRVKRNRVQERESRFADFWLYTAMGKVWPIQVKRTTDLQAVRRAIKQMSCCKSSIVVWFNSNRPREVRVFVWTFKHPDLVFETVPSELQKTQRDEAILNHVMRRLRDL